MAKGPILLRLYFCCFSLPIVNESGINSLRLVAQPVWCVRVGRGAVRPPAEGDRGVHAAARVMVLRP